MHDDKYSLVGMNKEDMDTQDTEMGFYRAIVAIDQRFRNGHLLQWIGPVPMSVKDAEDEYSILREMEFLQPHGIYVARFILSKEPEDCEWMIETNISDRITWEGLLN